MPYVSFLDNYTTLEFTSLLEPSIWTVIKDCMWDLVNFHCCGRFSSSCSYAGMMAVQWYHISYGAKFKYSHHHTRQWLMQLITNFLLQGMDSIPGQSLWDVLHSVALRWVFLWLIHFSPLLVIPLLFHSHISFIYHWHCNLLYWHCWWMTRLCFPKYELKNRIS